MSHRDKFRSSNASIKKEDWDRVFGPKDEPKTHEDQGTAYDPGAAGHEKQGRDGLPQVHRSSA